MSGATPTGELPIAGYGSPLQITPGEMLRKARETAGLGQREVSNRLYLTQTYVNCIEHNEWSKLPGDTFVRGYLRSYAALVGLSEAGVVAVYDAMLEEASEGERRRARNRGSSFSARLPGGVLAQRILIALFISMLAIGFVLNFSAEHDGSVAVEPESPVQDEADADSPQRDDPAQQEQSSSNSSQVPLAISGVPQQAAPAEVVADPDQQPAAVEHVTANPDRQQVISTASPAEADEAPTAAQDFGLRIELSEECWTQVKDGNGRVLTSRSHPKGSVLEYQGAAPYSLIIGNAAAASVQFAGQAVDLAAHTSANVARLTLGD